jgi:hypothetical protein
MLKQPGTINGSVIELFHVILPFHQFKYSFNTSRGSLAVINASCRFVQLLRLDKNSENSTRNKRDLGSI